jgi:hypothetical protein
MSRIKKNVRLHEKEADVEGGSGMQAAPSHVFGKLCRGAAE